MASILRVNTLTDASSNNSIATSIIHNGTAKMWLHFNQDTPAITKSYNVSSVTDQQTGYYRPNFSSNFSDKNYTCTSMKQAESTNDHCAEYIAHEIATTALTERRDWENSTARDAASSHTIAIGDLA
tara:strand:+ start:142 stop:522 length:381 start_codon:yes stop_codon:yes gene_type:complete